MSDFTPTPEQQAIVEAARSTKDNLLVNALAGAAKTSTLELVAKAVRGHPILSVAFNKRIADEMSKRLPSHCTCATMNSVGHRAWSSHLGRRLILDKDKTADIVKSLELTKPQQKQLRESFGDVMKLVGTAKNSGYVPDGVSYGQSLWRRDDFFRSSAQGEFDDFAYEVLDDILRIGIKQAYAGNIDFSDQIYMPTLFGAQLPKFPLTLVDEAQDLSPLNHYMVERLVGRNRLIAVGDPYQSIYGFRGAVSNGMEAFRLKFNMTALDLSISFRCPKAVVELARQRAPHMQYPEWAEEGKVSTLETFGPDDLPLRAAIICRNNAPLFSLGLKLLASGRNISLKGFDISKRLVKTLEELGPPDQSPSDSLQRLDAWKSEQLSKGKLGKGAIHDRYEALKVFVSAGEDLNRSVAYAKALFAAEGPLELLSGHKSKGLEWDHVFFLDSWRIPSPYALSPEDLEQESNVRYVITTRAKQTLTFIDGETFNGETTGNV